jgi:MinD superfamily P-loop ATPase
MIIRDEGKMRITIASGKGGTGKTTIATSLAICLAEDGYTTSFLDADVEAPNAHLFLEPELEQRQQVAILIPQVDENRCTYCGKCAQVCQYHAMVVAGQRTLVFPQLCHGCGSCALICPEAAIREVSHAIGVVAGGPARNGIHFARGVLNIGEPMAVPVIRELKKWVKPQPGQVELVDAPPGTSCSVVESMRGADFVLLITEPTPFGLHDLRLAAQVACALNIPAGVIVNRDGTGNAQVDEFCQAEGIPVLMRVPFKRAIAEGIAKGKTLIDICPEYRSHLKSVFSHILSHMQEAVR